MTEVMRLGPARSFRTSLAFRGLAFGSGAGLGVACWYLQNLLLIGGFLAPAVNGLVAGRPTDVNLFSVGVAVLSGAFGWVAGVLPATVAGAVAGGVIGALLAVIAPPGQQGSRPDWEALWTGTAVTSLVGGVAVIIVALTTQDLVLTPTGLAVVWIPAASLALAGGPFAVWLRRYAARRPGQAST